MAKNVFGLDIGGSFIKAVVIEHDKSDKQLVQVGLRPTPPKGLWSESELDLGFFSQSIKNLVTEAKINTKFVNCALPENQVFTKVIDVPNLTDKELSSAIHWEAEQYVPRPLSEVVLDYQVIQRPQASELPMQVLLVAAPIILINKYKRILENAGLVPVIFETETLSTARALLSGRESISFLIINMGASSTTLSIIRRGVLIFTFIIPTAGEAMTKTIAAEFNLELSEAEQYKKTYGLGEYLQGKVAASIIPIVKTIMVEVEKAIKFYQQKYSQETVESIVVAGGGAKLPGLTSHLAENLGVEVEMADPWRNIKVDPNNFKDAISEGSIFVVATGLALRDYE